MRVAAGDHVLVVQEHSSLEVAGGVARAHGPLEAERGQGREGRRVTASLSLAVNTLTSQAQFPPAACACKAMLLGASLPAAGPRTTPTQGTLLQPLRPQMAMKCALNLTTSRHTLLGAAFCRSTCTSAPRVSLSTPVVTATSRVGAAASATALFKVSRSTE